MLPSPLGPALYGAARWGENPPPIDVADERGDGAEPNLAAIVAGGESQRLARLGVLGLAVGRFRAVYKGQGIRQGHTHDVAGLEVIVVSVSFKEAYE